MTFEIIFGIVFVIVTIAILVFNKKANGELVEKVLKGSKFAKEGIEALQIAIDAVVQGLEQRKQNGELTNEQCKEIAMELAKQERDKLGIDISDKVLDLLVEAAVFGVNLFLGKETTGDSIEPEQPEDKPA